MRAVQCRSCIIYAGDLTRLFKAIPTIEAVASINYDILKIYNELGEGHFTMKIRIL